MYGWLKDGKVRAPFASMEQLRADALSSGRRSAVVGTLVSVDPGTYAEECANRVLAHLGELAERDGDV
jgi:hypothetical protein